MKKAGLSQAGLVLFAFAHPATKVLPRSWTRSCYRCPDCFPTWTLGRFFSRKTNRLQL